MFVLEIWLTFNNREELNNIHSYTAQGLSQGGPGVPVTPLL